MGVIDMAQYLDGAELYEACMTQATAVVKQVRADHFANVTPYADWSVRDLLGHMLTNLTFVPEVIAGDEVDDSDLKYDDELLGDDDIELSANWQVAADKAEMTIGEIDPDETAHISSGEVTLDNYLTQAASDMLIHTWDLGKSIGVPVKFDAELAEILYENVAPHQRELQGSGLYSPEVEVIGDVDIQTRLLALFGRRADWKAV